MNQYDGTKQNHSQQTSSSKLYQEHIFNPQQPFNTVKVVISVFIGKNIVLREITTLNKSVDLMQKQFGINKHALFVLDDSFVSDDIFKTLIDHSQVSTPRIIPQINNYYISLFSEFKQLLRPGWNCYKIKKGKREQEISNTLSQ